MCGIAGFVTPAGLSREWADAMVDSMTRQILHRGPDDGGAWIDDQAGLALGHRRLSILDLSAAGHQPMTSPSGRFVITFNGEIYNHLALRSALKYSNWQGHSDTETLLAAIESWGVEQALQRSIGMFAFGLWDKESHVLTLARDRMGEKPLYYGWQGRGEQVTFLFGSELKALRAHSAFEGVIDRGALCLQLRHNYIPAPYSIYRGIHKLLPGHILQMSPHSARPSQTFVTRPYWSLAQAIDAGKANPFTGNEQDAVRELDVLLRDAVRQQMVADVPLGAFLSGGIDSSTIVALMQAQSSRPAKTFTIGFAEESYSEAQQARKVAEHLGTDHTELYVSPKQALEVIARLPDLYDEPFADSSQIPTFLVAQLARSHVAVALSGDAGDELFCGYDRYFKAQRIWNFMQKVPSPLKWLGGNLRAPAPALAGTLSRYVAGAISRDKDWSFSMARRAELVTALLAARDPASFYMPFISDWLDPARVVIGGAEYLTPMSAPEFSLSDFTEQLMALDTITYLPDEILAKVDRAAMGTSLETRVPFLDHRVVEFAWRLPMATKVHGGTGKWILRQVLHRYVPKALVDRPKMGFGVPIDSWLRGPLREWAENLLSESRLRQEGLFKPEQIRRKWTQHLSGHSNWRYLLWDVLMFEAWMENERRWAGRRRAVA